MLRTTLTTLWHHRRRFVATVLAVMLGVGFMTGTRMLNDTIDASLSRLWRMASVSTDVVVRGPAIYTTNQGRTQYAPVPDSAVDKVAAVPGVDAVGPRKNASDVRLLSPDGSTEADGRGGGYVRSWPTDQRFALNTVVQGRGPEALGELAMDRTLAEDSGYRLGDTATLQTAAGPVDLEVVGITERAEDNDQRGWGAMSATVAQVQTLSGQPGELDGIDVIAASDTSPTDLVAAIEAAAVSPDASVQTAAEVEQENAERFRRQVELFTQLLLLFSAVALFVTAFIIANTFGILVAQRTRELALLRAIGATRRQVLLSVLTEAAVVGAIASVLGIIMGIALAWLAVNGLGALGLRLPTSALVIDVSHSWEAVLVGLAVTVGAATLPAIRATRVAPVTALRATEIDVSAESRMRIAVGLVLGAVGAFLVRPAFGTTPPLDALSRIGVGLVLLLVALLVLGPAVVGPTVRALAAPLPALRGVTGRLAAQNARRNPRRTASTVASLVIGVALVGFITVLASSARASVHQSLTGGFRGDLLVRPEGRGGSFGADPSLRRELADAPSVEAVTAITGTSGQLTLPNGDQVATELAGIDPATYPALFDLPIVEGTLDGLGDDGLIVNRLTADEHGLVVGNRVTAVSLRNKRMTFVVRALVHEDALLPDWSTSRAGIEALTATPGDLLIAVRTTGPDAEARHEVEAIVARHPTMAVQDVSEYTADESGDIDSILNLLYAMLAISIVIALIGITNTLALSVHERTREIGLLRAVGMTRSQVKAMIRWEAVTVGVIGAVIGLVAGLGIAYVIVQALSGRGLTVFDVPVRALAGIVIGGAVLGVVAALRPAATAARVDVVDALAHD